MFLFEQGPYGRRKEFFYCFNKLLIDKRKIFMKSYELVYLVAGDIPEIELKKVQKKVLEIIAKHGGKVIKEDFWGKKPLAYQIKKQDYAFYSVLLLDLEPDKVGHLEADFKLTEKMIRYLLTVKEEIKVKKGVKKAKPKKVAKSIKKVAKPVESASAKASEDKKAVKQPERIKEKPKPELKPEPKPKKEEPRLEKPKTEEKESLTEKDKKEILEEKERESALDKELEKILKEE